jgi:DNA-binding beta-propeller fold protein YncE
MAGRREGSREFVARAAARLTRVAAALAAAAALAPAARAQVPRTTDAAGAHAAAPEAAAYHLVIANESSDLVSRLTYRPGAGFSTDGTVPVGLMPADVDGPHGIAVSPDGRHWYVSLAHGTPFGKVWKYTTAGDSLVGRVDLGLFPATMGLTPDGQFLFVVNFNLHGDPVPSSVSVVHTPTMTELARPVTCVMPHGSRVNAAGTKQYSACMHSEQVVELDTRTFQVSARLSVAPGHERALALEEAGGDAAHAASEGAVCSPTWVQPAKGPRANRFVYVPCNRGGGALEIDAERWEVTRRFSTGKGPYNMDVTPDGRLLLITLKGGQGVQVIDLETGRERARIRTTQPVTHGVVVTPDGRYAFVTNEAIGATRGTVDAIDLARLERVASTEVAYQPGGIDLYVEGSPRR